MSLIKYRALLKAAELGSISRAAEQMDYTQSAVSRMIADLEKEWGLELLRRSREGVEGSSALEMLLPVLRSIAADCDELDFLIGELHGLQKGLIRVGTITSVADTWIPGLLTSFRKKYPGIDFELINSEDYTEIEGLILRGRIDCGFVSLPTAGDLSVWFLKQDMLVAVLPMDHPLKDADIFPADQLEKESIIKLKETADYEIARFLDGLPHRPVPRFEVSNDHTILSMVESGLGMSIMHSLYLEKNRYNVIWKPFDRPQYRDIGIATARGARLGHMTQLFVDHVCSRLLKDA